jgi:glutathionylspermidine synthase
VERQSSEPRPGWQTTIEEQGLIYWPTILPDGSEISYWNEESYYSFTTSEIYEMEAAVRLLMEMLVEAGDAIIERNLFAKMGIPGWAVPRIKETWITEPPMLYGRFDFAYGPEGFKLLEYNADTPTALLETAVQWHWVQDVFGPSGDQWNSVHEALIARWKELADGDRLPGDRLYMCHTIAEQSGEDFTTVGYLTQTASEAGLEVELMSMEQIGFDEDVGFVDMEGRPMRTVFKLYPWEWMVHEDFAHPAMEKMGAGEGQTIWIEPIWKMLWSNKGILPVLWDLYPDHPNLLPAYFDGEQPEGMKDFVRKPLLAREGANAVAVIDGDVAEEGPDQDYGEEGFVVQKYTDLGEYEGWRPVLGVWTVDMEPVGCGIREQAGLITNNTSRFTPHVIAD